MNILTLFFDIDEFCKAFEPFWNNHLVSENCKKRNRRRQLCLSEVMTILVLFHISGYRNFKQFYLKFVCRHLRSERVEDFCKRIVKTRIMPQFLGL